ncbi:MAG: hypothetical protein IIY17_00260, partial [Aeriscardovia sp.]|nr:hypothetical protein [Aeriscardovia sp.]
RVATEGAGDYWFGIYGIVAGDTLGEADGNMMLRVNVSRATNTDDLTKPSYDADRALVSKSVLLNKESYSRTGSYAYFDGTDSHIRFYVYAYGASPSSFPPSNSPFSSPDRSGRRGWIA